MRVAIPVWHGRISPLLDSANVIRIYQIDNHGLELAEEFCVDEIRIVGLPTACAGHQVDMVICGAVSSALKCMLEKLGIDICSWVCGDANEVICAYYAEKSLDERFSLPGKH